MPFGKMGFFVKSLQSSAQIFLQTAGATGFEPAAGWILRGTFWAHCLSRERLARAGRGFFSLDQRRVFASQAGMKKTASLLICIGLFAGTSSTALALSKASFPSILQRLTPEKNYITASVPQLAQLNAAPSLEAAAQIVRDMVYSQIALQPKSQALPQDAVVFDALIKKRQLTFVIVPGLLGEFIQTRAFEEVFSRPSSYQKTWQSLALKSGLTDPRLDLQKFADENRPIGEMIDAASIDDKSGKPLIKVIILTTKLGSLESVGDNVKQAQVFNRRLEKYVQISHDQNLVLLGYSRGTPLALEMITQAQKQNLSYFSKVKGLVAHAGVIMGSSLADLTADESTESGRLFAGARELADSLQYSHDPLLHAVKYAENSAAIAKFVGLVALNTKPNFLSTLKTIQNGDFHATSALILGMIDQLKLLMITDFNGHVSRVKTLISEILISVEQLRTGPSKQWWTSHDLPKNIDYYSLSAVMVDKDRGGIEQTVYQAHEGYDDTLDDDGLLDNKRTYEKATGIALNDSQVAIHQSQFLPGVIAGLNPHNQDLNFQSLGILQTHHWGVSLKAVNAESDGRVSPFPREKILQALAIYLNQ